MNTPRNASGSPERANAQGPQVDSLEGAPTDAESTTAAAGTFPANDTATMFRRALVRAILSTLDASTRAALLSALGAWLRALVLVCVDGGTLYDAERAEERAFVLSAARVALGDIAVMLGEVGEVDGGRDEVAVAVTAGQGGEHAAFVAALLEYAAEHEAPALALDAAHAATRDTGAHAATMLLLAAEHVCEHGATLTRSPGRAMGEPNARERELCAVYMRDVARLLTLASKALDTTSAGRAS